MINKPELIEDPRFITNADRTNNEPALKEILDAVFVTDTIEHWLEKLEAATDKAASIEEPKAQAIAYRDEVFTTMSELREPADALEMLVDKSVWPFPTYGDLLFNV